MDIAAWPHRWFGVWQEFGPEDKVFPSIHEFVAPPVVATYNKPQLRAYLENSKIVASTTRAAFPTPFTGTRHEGAISYRTDGTRLWLDDLPPYIDQFDFAIPTAWLRLIEERDYKICPHFDESAVIKLDWPSLGP